MQTTHALSSLDTPSANWQLPGLRIAQIAARLGREVFQLNKLSNIYNDVRDEEATQPFADRTLTHLGVGYSITHGALSHIPAQGPLLIVANHPFGGVEGLVLLSLLSTIRPDIKLIANEILSVIPELHKHMILVNPFGGQDAAAKNTQPLRQSFRWLQKGGALAMFPSGEVAHFDLATKRICESAWHTTVARLVRHSGATVLPIFFEGANGPIFQIAGLIHPKLRTIMLAREIINKTGHLLKVSIGKPLSFDKLNTVPQDANLTEYLKLRVQLLGATHPALPSQRPIKLWSKRPGQIIKAEAKCVIAAELAWLRPEQILVEVGDYQVYIAEAQHIPSVVREIARLREITFRAAGEGTGKCLDIDVFDRIYQHLFIWNKATQEVVGAYRLGMTDKILPKYGLSGLYTTTLFKYSWDMLDVIIPAIEVGRSFVRKEYQRKHLPLLLLWKGIGVFVARNPKYPNLFGTVSMSNCYHPLSRQLVSEFFKQPNQCLGNFPSVTPRTPLKPKASHIENSLKHTDRIPDLDALSEMISEIETDKKGIPVLLRQYMKLGGRVLACNVDKKFNMALDAFLVVDLTRTDPRLLETYMGPLTSDYLRHHGIAPESEKHARCA